MSLSNVWLVLWMQNNCAECCCYLFYYAHRSLMNWLSLSPHSKISTAIKDGRVKRPALQTIKSYALCLSARVATYVNMRTNGRPANRSASVYNGHYFDKVLPLYVICSCVRYMVTDADSNSVRQQGHWLEHRNSQVGAPAITCHS